MPFMDDRERWRAVATRDARAEGAFVYAVLTTGVYCRPTCPSRRPLRKNAIFFDDPQAAAAAGFRACRRCAPDGGDRDSRTKAILAACRSIDTAETPPSLAVLAADAGLSPHHFHRVFKSIVGVTPKAYASARRARRLGEGLAGGGSVTGAIYDAGYNAPSRCYEDSQSRLGMRPAAYRDGGVGARIRFAVGETSLGPLLVAATDKGLCAIDFGDDAGALVRDLEDRFPKAELIGADAGFEALVAAVCARVETPRAPGADLPLDIRGTAFQQRVWAELRKIPAGTTASYAEVARAIGAPGATRAVARACGANTLAVAIPCHRVVRSDGAISGYRWGVDRKRALLDRERTG